MTKQIQMDDNGLVFIKENEVMQELLFSKE